MEFKLFDKDGNHIGNEYHEANEHGIIQMYHKSLRGDWVDDNGSKRLLREGYYIPHAKKELVKSINANIVLISLPTDIEMDKNILEILDDNLVAGTLEDNTEGIICNRFATSLKIVHYIKGLLDSRKSKSVTPFK